MNACSMQSVIDARELGVALIVAGVVVLVPLVVAALAGAYVARARGRSAPRGAIVGAGAVLLAYAAGAAVWGVYLSVMSRHVERTTAAADPVRDFAPGSLAENLAVLALDSSSAEVRDSQAHALDHRLELGNGWTPADWQAVAAFERKVRRDLERGGLPTEIAERLRGRHLAARRGVEDPAGAREACDGNAACESVFEATLAREAQLRVAAARDRFFGAGRLDASTLAALERHVERDGARSAEDRAALAWERLAPGRIESALAACGSGLPAFAQDEPATWRCVAAFADAIVRQGAARACEGGRLRDGDAVVLADMAGTLARSGAAAEALAPRWEEAMARVRADCGGGAR